MYRQSQLPRPDPAEVLAKATARAVALLGLSGAALARIIGLSEATVSRILSGERPLDLAGVAPWRSIPAR